MNNCLDLKSLSPTQLTFYSTAFAVVIADCLTADELQTWGSFFFNVGSSLKTIANQKTLLNNYCKNNTAK